MNILRGSISKDLIFLDLNLSNKEEVITFLANKLYDLGYVKDTYLHNVLLRESVYPTGLLLDSYNVAIPHTESEHVYKSGIVIGRLKNPVIFKYMADPNQDVAVNLVVMLAIKDPKNQVPVLSELMTGLSNKKLLNFLMDVDTVSEFIDVITK